MSTETTNPGATDLAAFGKALALAREQSRLSVAELGELLGVTRQAVMLWENGSRQPDHKLVTHMEVLLNLKAGSLTRLSHPHIERQPPGSVEQAIQADVDLTDFQKRALLGVVQAFRP